MSEEEPYEENLSENDKKRLKMLRTRISVENPEAINKELSITAEIPKEAVDKVAWFDDQAKKLAKELSDAGSQTDSSEITPENFKERVSELKDLKDLRRNAERDADPTAKPSSGVLTLRGQNYNPTEKDSWNSVSEMVRDLFTVRNAGSKRQQTKASLVIEKLHRKAWKGHEKKGQPLPQIEFKGEVDPETGKEKGLIETLNEEYRKRKKLERESRNAED